MAYPARLVAERIRVCDAHRRGLFYRGLESIPLAAVCGYRGESRRPFAGVDGARSLSVCRHAVSFGHHRVDLQETWPHTAGDFVAGAGPLVGRLRRFAVAQPGCVLSPASALP